MVTKCHCNKTACFNIPGSKKGAFCKTHKTDDMVNVIDKLCLESGCEFRASFGFPAKKPEYCSTHQKEGMFNLKSCVCKFLYADGKKCYNSPIYNTEGEKKGIYCLEHKLDGMINVIGVRCEEEGCKTGAQFNYDGETVGRFCAKHRFDGMIDIKHRRCEKDGCNILPSYKFDTDSSCRFCAFHKLDGMIDGKHKRCAEKGCTLSPSFNYEDETVPLFCSEHKLDDMIDVKHARCSEANCYRRPLFNFAEEKTGAYCISHKKEGMVNLAAHKCLSGFCENRIYTEKYDGYCLFCCVHLFPDKVSVRNYKTKEKSVVDFVTRHFSNYTWVADKKVADGCSRRRPDLLLDMGSHVIIIEIDENQHVNYDSTCELKRMNQLTEDLGFRPIVYIRFNPDSYIKKGNVKEKSCWMTNKQGIFVINSDQNNLWKKRLDLLKNTIEFWTNKTTENLIETIHLFFDET